MDRGRAARPSRVPAASSGSCCADLRRHALHEPALAQAAGAEHHAAHAGQPQQPAQHHGGERQIVDAAARQRRAAAPARAAPAPEISAGQVARLLAADRVVVHHVQRIAGLRHVDARQRPPGAADQIQVARRPLSASHGTVGKIGFGDRARPHRIAAGALGQPDHAEAQRLRRAARAGVQPHQLPASRRRYRRECRSAAGMPHSTPSADSSASSSAGQDADRHARHALLQRRDEIRRRCAHRAPRRWPAPRTARAPMARATAW